MSDPFWFQAFGCVLGFDWHSSGVTTTVCGAVKESLRETGPEWGLFAAGGKGAASRKKPGADCRRAASTSAAIPARSSTPAAPPRRSTTRRSRTATSSITTSFSSRRPGDWSRRPAGHERRDVDGAAVPLAVGARDELRGRAARRGLLRRARRDAEPGGERERRRAARMRELAALPPETTLRASSACPICGCRARHLLFPEMDVDTRYLSKILLKTLRARARGLRDAARHRRRRPEDTARAGAGARADLRHAREHARSGAIRVRRSRTRMPRNAAVWIEKFLTAKTQGRNVFFLETRIPSVSAPWR